MGDQLSLDRAMTGRTFKIARRNFRAAEPADLAALAALRWYAVTAAFIALL